MVFQKLVVVDCRDHLAGRLASVVAKELLLGQKVVLVRSEECNISGPLFRNKLIYQDFLRKRTNTNPRRGPFHQRAPSRILWRMIRGMIPHKTHRGQAALAHLKIFEGVPAPYDAVKRAVIPDALRVLRLSPGREFCKVGDLSKAFGWKHGELIEKLEAKRKVRSAAFHSRKVALNKLRAQAVASIKK